MFSKTAEYALRATIYIAQKSTPEKKLGIEEISQAIGSPRSFTAKILQMLTRNNRIVSSLRGPNGGFFMNDAARSLPARAILEAVEEDDVLRKCILGLRECSEIKPCPMHSEYKIIRERLNHLFEEMTIERLAIEMSKKDIFLNNDRDAFIS